MTVQGSSNQGADFDMASSGDAALFCEMRVAYGQLEHAPLRQVLLESMEAEGKAMKAIARGFAGFLAGRQDPDIRRQFFASWQRTNNSVMSVDGLAARISADAEASVGNAGREKALSLFRAAGELNRVADADLGVGGQPHHFELYYRMATQFTEDDQWQSRRFCLPAAAEFKSWLDSARLGSPILVGLYTLLLHEGYTHAELELIAGPFQRWATAHMGLSDGEARRTLAWITVHNNGVEKAHFAHGCAALTHYLEGSGESVDLRLAGETFRKYFRLKGAVMAQLSETYRL